MTKFKVYFIKNNKHNIPKERSRKILARDAEEACARVIHAVQGSRNAYALTAKK